MKASVRVNNELSFQVEAETEEKVFKQVARVQEIFQHQSCGKCNSPNVKFVCRHDSSENDWLEVVCQDCRGKLIFGRTKKGGQIYPKIRWDQLSEKQKEQRINEKGYADNNRGYLPDKGWFIYKPVSSS
jgi:RNase P subunit RPR2|tara:strand:- start:815 stop:1201 length:387 start_codon:yes stop_codon:yes gene_type:complete